MEDVEKSERAKALYDLYFLPSLLQTYCQLPFHWPLSLSLLHFPLGSIFNLPLGCSIMLCFLGMVSWVHKHWLLISCKSNEAGCCWNFFQWFFFFCPDSCSLLWKPSKKLPPESIAVKPNSHLTGKQHRVADSEIVDRWFFLHHELTKKARRIKIKSGRLNLWFVKCLWES